MLVLQAMNQPPPFPEDQIEATLADLIASWERKTPGHRWHRPDRAMAIRILRIDQQMAPLRAASARIRAQFKAKGIDW